MMVVTPLLLKMQNNCNCTGSDLFSPPLLLLISPEKEMKGLFLAIAKCFRSLTGLDCRHAALEPRLLFSFSLFSHYDHWQVKWLTDHPLVVVMFATYQNMQANHSPYGEQKPPSWSGQESTLWKTAYVEKESEVFAWLPNSQDTDLIRPNRTFWQHAIATETPAHNPQLWQDCWQPRLGHPRYQTH